MSTYALTGKVLEFGEKIVYCIAIVIFCVILVKISSIIIEKIFAPNNSIKIIDGRKRETLKSVILSISKYAIYFLAGFSILTYMGVPVASLIAVAGVGSVAIGFGAQSLVKDVLTGFFLLFEDQFGIGDIVEIEGREGVVESISLRTTHVRGWDGSLYIIPNSSITIVASMSKTYTNALIDVGIDYREDIQHAIDVLKDEMQIVSGVVSGLKATPVILGVVDLADSAVVLRIMAECEPESRAAIARELRLRVKNRLDKEKIAIPVPQMRVFLND